MPKRMPSCDTGVVVYLSNGDGYHISEIEKLLEVARQPMGVEPVAWQWRSRVKGGAWDAWENGRYGSEPAPFMEVQHRALYAAPPAPAAVPADCGYCCPSCGRDYQSHKSARQVVATHRQPTPTKENDQ